MITMVVLHILAEENRKQAEALIKRNTELARKAKGFVSRHLFRSLSDPLKCYSITTWETREDLDNFRKNPERPLLEYEGEDRRVYERTPAGRMLLFTRIDTDLFEQVEFS